MQIFTKFETSLYFCGVLNFITLVVISQRMRLPAPFLAANAKLEYPTGFLRMLLFNILEN